MAGYYQDEGLIDTFVKLHDTMLGLMQQRLQRRIYKRKRSKMSSPPRQKQIKLADGQILMEVEGKEKGISLSEDSSTDSAQPPAASPERQSISKDKQPYALPVKSPVLSHQATVHKDKTYCDLLAEITAILKQIRPDEPSQPPDEESFNAAMKKRIAALKIKLSESFQSDNPKKSER